MTATSIDIDTPELVDGQVVNLPVAASTHIYKGSLVALSSGYLVSATNAASRVFAGIALDGPNNNTGDTTSAGYRTCNVATKGIFLLNVTSVAESTSKGSVVYATDNQTCQLTPGYLPVGKVVRYHSSGKAYVEIGAYSLVADPWDVRTYCANFGQAVTTDGGMLWGISTTGATVPKTGWISQFRTTFYGTTTLALVIKLRNGTTAIATMTNTDDLGKDWYTQSYGTCTPSLYISKDGGFSAEVVTLTNCTYGTLLVEVKSPK